MINGHKTRFSDSSFYDEKCIYCGATDCVPGGMGELAYRCPESDHHTQECQDDKSEQCICPPNTL